MDSSLKRRRIDEPAPGPSQELRGCNKDAAKIAQRLADRLAIGVAHKQRAPQDNVAHNSAIGAPSFKSAKCRLTQPVYSRTCERRRFGDLNLRHEFSYKFEREFGTTQRKMLRRIVCPCARGTLDDTECFVNWMKLSARRILDLSERGRVSDWASIQAQRKWNWAGNCVRHTDGRWTERAMHIGISRFRRQSRPKIKWEDDKRDFLTSKYGR